MASKRVPAPSPTADDVTEDFLESGRKYDPRLSSSSVAFGKALMPIAADLDVEVDSLGWEGLVSLVANLTAAHEEGGPLGIPMARSAFPTVAAARRYGLRHMAWPLLPELVHGLQRRGLLHLVPGSQKAGRRTRIWATDELTRMLPRAFAPAWSPFDDPLVLKDEHGRLLAYPNTRQRDAMRRRLERVNELLASTDVDLAPGHGCDDQVLVAEVRQVRALCRIFNRSSWLCGGRFYSAGGWQRLPKEFRRYLLLNGAPVTEVDFSSLHLRLLYNRVGLDPAGDLHELPGFPESREASKCLALVAINARTRGQALGAFRKKVRTDADVRAAFESQPLDVPALYGAVVQRHDPIARFIGSDEGIRLQRVDSDILGQVLDELTAMGIPALPLHDSCIVQVHDADLLDRLMRRSYERTTGFSIPTKRTESALSLWARRVAYLRYRARHKVASRAA